MSGYFVYKHTSPNGKVYIGITKQVPERRWKNGFGYESQRYLSYAIKKYGWDNIKHEILFSGLTKEEASSKEIELIALHKSNHRSFGYNIEGGGINKIVTDETIQRLRNSHIGKKLSPEQREKISIALSGHINPHKGECLSESHKKKISEGLKGHIISEETRRKLRESNLGKRRSAEAKKKMSQSHKGLKPTKETIAKWRESNKAIMTPVEQLDIKTDNIIARFDSTMDAFRNTGVDASSIRKCCIGERKSAGNYKWRYAADIQTS